jgi:hypothetical protein
VTPASSENPGNVPADSLLDKQVVDPPPVPPPHLKPIYSPFEDNGRLAALTKALSVGVADIPQLSAEEVTTTARALKVASAGVDELRKHLATAIAKAGSVER